ncbi:MAG: hypothetical protein LAO78_00510 [Acidobacteriia bacterium]|nr:hypothetical protein [Terriglobia bacterium]
MNCSLFLRISTFSPEEPCLAQTSGDLLIGSHTTVLSCLDSAVGDLNRHFEHALTSQATQGNALSFAPPVTISELTEHAFVAAQRADTTLQLCPDGMASAFHQRPNINSDTMAARVKPTRYPDMEVSKSRGKSRRVSGFALIETVIAISILAFGLLALAALLAQMGGNSTKSRYMSTEALLASEKLDDLNRYPYNDPAIAVPSGTSSGSLTADLTATVTVGAVTEVVDYFDQVRISSGNGKMVETVSGKDASGNIVYTTTTHAPDGSISVVTATNAPAATPDMLTFSRRWAIEVSPANLPTGVRRFTVLVSLQNATAPTDFQASMLR